MKLFKDQEKSINEIMQAFENDQRIFFYYFNGTAK